MVANAASSSDSAYDVRRYRSEDRDDVVGLLEPVFDDSGARFAWACEDNPYLDHVPMTVASTAGSVVAVQPAVGFRLRLGERELLALLATDPVVHPDHRGRGLPARLDGHMQDVYADREPALCFSVVDSKSTAARSGWRAVGPVSTAYRLCRPQVLLDGDDGFCRRAGTRLLGSVLRTPRRLWDVSPSGVDAVARTDHVPVRTLTDLARQHSPSGLHAVRNPRYLSWRFQHPGWTYRTYLTGSDVAQAAVVVGRRRHQGREVVALTDLHPPDSTTRPRAVQRLVTAALGDFPDANAFVAAGPTLPRSVRRSTGFRLDDQWPVSWLTDRSTLLTRPATGRDPAATDWVVGGRDVTDPASWHLSLAERDTW